MRISNNSNGAESPAVSLALLYRLSFTHRARRVTREFLRQVVCTCINARRDGCVDVVVVDLHPLPVLFRVLIPVNFPCDTCTMLGGRDYPR